MTTSKAINSIASNKSTSTVARTKNRISKVERYFKQTLFEESLFSDLSLVLIHPSFPFSMRFNVHKGIVSQSPFLRRLLLNADLISVPDSVSAEEQERKKSRLPMHMTTEGGISCLTIDLAKALTHCGFVLTPFQHIVRRKWQKASNDTNNDSNDQNSNNSSIREALRPLLSSHIRFVLKWMYCINKQELLDTMEDQDTLRVLFVAVLFDLHDLTQACVNRYTRKQLCLTSMMHDLETICQLPRGHSAYLQLRDASLLLLFRYGTENATLLSTLPVDYMADVLSADPLFVSSEFERYCLLRAVLMAYMQSLGKITFTPTGPVDQDLKRLSGYVRPLQPKFKKILSGLSDTATTSSDDATTVENTSSTSSPSNNQKLQQSSKAVIENLSADTVRSRKRKRIPSAELERVLPEVTKRHTLHRLSFSALVPFEKLVADASSGGVINKATVLSYLLRTTVQYSNMTFEQLTSVRHDGIVDEGIVFRALWQREALERVLFPLTYQPHQQTQDMQHQQQRIRRNSTSSLHDDDGYDESSMTDDERTAALNEYFDVDDTDAQERRRRLLLGTPRFRFRSSIFINPPSEENGWECEEKEVTTDVDMHAFDDDNDSNSSLWLAYDEETNTNSKERALEKPLSSSQGVNEGIQQLEIGQNQLDKPQQSFIVTATSESLTNISTNENTQLSLLLPSSPQQKQKTIRYKLYRKNFYSKSETILGTSYRVQIEAQVMPRHRLHINDDLNKDDDEEEDDVQYYADSDPNDNVLVCRFELQRGKRQIVQPPPPLVKIKKEKDTQPASKANTATTTTITKTNTNTQPTTNTATANIHTNYTNNKKPKSQIPISTKAIHQAKTNSDDGIIIPVTPPPKNASSITVQQPLPSNQNNNTDKGKIHYWIYCLNRHEGILENDRIDPEDRVLVAVTEQCERENGEPGEMGPGYVGQVLVDADLKEGVTVDVTVALEIFGFQKV